MRTLFAGLAVLAAGLATATLAWPRRDVPHPSPPRSDAPRATVLARRVLRFREDDERERVVAVVEATVARDATGVRLHLHASTVAPLVDPTPGFTGVRGGNRIAAEELDALLARGGLTLRAADGVRAPPVPGMRGRVVERRLLADGRVVHAPAGDADVVRDATLSSAALRDGRHGFEVVADAHVRLRAVVRVDGTAARIERLVQVDERGEEVGP